MSIPFRFLCGSSARPNVNDNNDDDDDSFCSYHLFNFFQFNHDVLLFRGMRKAFHYFHFFPLLVVLSIQLLLDLALNVSFCRCSELFYKINLSQ